jgi:hypothetical protein
VAFWVKYQGRAKPTTSKDPNILSMTPHGAGAYLRHEPN